MAATRYIPIIKNVYCQFKKRTVFWITVLVCGFIRTNASAQATTAAPGELVSFIDKAYAYNLNEISNGNMALKKAMDGGVKSFGSQEAADHLQLNTQLEALAKSKGLQKPKTDTTVNAGSGILAQSKGADFDSAFLQVNVQTDQEVIALYKSALINIKDPEVVAFIKKNLPVLNDHLREAKILEKQTNPTKH